MIDRCGQVLQVPVALLSLTGDAWRFEGEEIPSSDQGGGASSWSRRANAHASGDQPWTGIVIGGVGGRDWVLMVPGAAQGWRDVRWLETFVNQVRWSLERVTAEDEERRQRRLGRQVYAFSRRLARPLAAADIHPFILRTLAAAVRARTASIAVYDQHLDAYTIASTVGYPSAIVEHVLVTPGFGILGRAAVSRKAVLGIVEEPHRRLRYRGDSYLLQPLVHGNRALALVALTDHADGRPFDHEDLAVTRALAARRRLR